MDRLYITPQQIGLEIKYGCNNSVLSGKINGEKIKSGREARKLKYSKVYIDIKDGSTHAEDERLITALHIFLEGKLNDYEK